ncbi:MAG: MBL fold metallo-hydrolase [Deltaproteobacteria bacterium]|nr:MBL fold metallo-hydrolase [Deltaproteobacteria bacterium]
MADGGNCLDVRGLTVISAGSHLWPNPSNLCVIKDDKGFSMIDVGCGGPAGYDHLHAGLTRLGLALDDLHTVVLSHAHPDHMGAMKYVLEAVHPKVFIHSHDVEAALDISLLHESFDIPLAKEKFAPLGTFQDFDLFEFFDVFGCSMNPTENVEAVNEGDILRLGDFEFEVLLTPGHAPGHISLFERRIGVLLANDLVGVSPAWYTPNSGGLRGYLASLDTLESKKASVLIPSHGPVVKNPEAGIGRMREKLLKREAILCEALRAGPQTFMELLSALFRDAGLHFFPGCGILESHLIKLAKEGKIQRGEDLISLTHVSPKASTA